MGSLGLCSLSGPGFLREIRALRRRRGGCRFGTGGASQAKTRRGRSHGDYPWESEVPRSRGGRRAFSLLPPLRWRRARVILLPNGAHHGRSARRDGSHEQVGRWPLDHHRLPVDADLAESGLFDQSPELNAVAQREPWQRPSLSSKAALQGTLNRRVWWAVIRGAPAGDPQSSAGPEDPSHLAKGLEPIGEELEALLTEDEIKDVLIEGQPQSLRFEP
jgi:hypothetical protein